MAIVGFLLFTIFGIAQVYAGYLGIEYHFGAGWAAAALFGCLFFRFTLPITIGSFFGAMNVWEWHWALSLLFVAPGLAFVIPGFVLSLYERARGYSY